MARRVLTAAALAALVATPADATTTKGAAIAKVVTMLQDMAAKCKEDKHKEEVAFSGWKQWCGDQQSSLTAQIAQEGQEIASMAAEVEELGESAKVLGEEVAQLQSDVMKYEADLKANKKQRESEHKEFLAEQKDYGESVDALERAINMLNKQNYDRTGSFLQAEGMEALPANAKAMISAFEQMMDAPDSSDDSSFLATRSAPEANVYEFQSGGIVEMLKKLKMEFTDKKSECEKEEQNSQHAHEMIVQDLADSAEQANEDIGTKSALSQDKIAKKALMEKQHAQTVAVKAEDEKTLSDTNVECAEQTESFKEKQVLRSEEIQALTQAIEVLSSQTVQGTALSAVQKGTSLIQTVTDTETDTAGIRRKVMEFLKQRSEVIHSSQLGLLAEKMATDPFVKVRKMIGEMITRLLDEANQEAEHKGFCDKEVGQSKITRTKLSEEIDGLNAEVEQGHATIDLLANDIARLSKEVAEIDEAVTSNTKFRQEESAANAATIKDASAASKAVAQAVSLLKEFYGKAAGATALMQVGAKRPTIGSEEWNALANPDAPPVDKGHKEGMQTFGEQYNGQQDQAGGVLAMLEVIASDFAALEADTEASEATAQRAFEAFLAESKKDKAMKERKTQMNQNDKVNAEAKLQEDISDMKFAQDKLLSANRYFDRLKPQCMDKGQTFDERTASRQEEIQSLKEALKILNGEA